MKIIELKIDVRFDTTPPIFTYINKNDQITDGSCTTKKGTPEQIQYTLKKEGFEIVEFVITNDFKQTVSGSICNKGQTLEITNNAEHLCDVGLQIVIQDNNTKLKYVSPDPRVRVDPIIG